MAGARAPADLVPCTLDRLPPSAEIVQEYYFLLADAMIKNPGASLFDIANIIKRPPRWVAFIRCSDSFREYYKARHDEVINGIKRKTETLVELSLDRLIDRVETIGDSMPTPDLSEIVDKGSRRLGYGGTTPAGGVAVTVGVAVGRDDLESARQRMQEKFGTTPEAPAAPQVSSSRSREAIDLVAEDTS